MTWLSFILLFFASTYHSFAVRASQLKICDFRGFEVLTFSVSATTTQLLSSGEFWKLHYDIIPKE
jgi:hypothetical protein